MTATDVRIDEDPGARLFRGGGKLLTTALVVGLVGSVLTIVGAVLDPIQAAFSYLIAFAYVLSLFLGALLFVLAVHASNATWPVAIRRLPEAVIAGGPLLAGLFVPVAFAIPVLYPWARPAGLDPETLHLLAHKRPYLNLPFVLARAAIFFAAWIAIGAVLRRWSLRMDRPLPHEDLRARLRRLSSLTLPVVGLFGTMAAWDWLMALSPDWFSTMFGLNYLAGGFLAALAVVTLLALSARHSGYLPELGADHRYALGRLLFAFLVFWAYTWYWQYFLIWIANRPLEVRWFVARTEGAYSAVAWFLIVGHFGVPFFILLSYWVKRRARALGAVAAWILFAHYFDVHWLIAAARRRPWPFSWMDAATLAAVLGLFAAFALWRQRGRLVAPVFDPLFRKALEYRSR